MEHICNSATIRYNKSYAAKHYKCRMQSDLVKFQMTNYALHVFQTQWNCNCYKLKWEKPTKCKSKLGGEIKV